MSLPERLRIIRGKLGQKEFAKRIGSSQTGVSAYEKGQRKPDYETLIRVSKEFGVTLDWLLLGVEPMYCSGLPKKQMADSRPTEKKHTEQPIDNIDKNFFTSQQNGRQSAIWDYMEKTIALQERLLTATEQVAELRLQLQARDIRIRDLEKENAQLREARKGTAYPGAGIAGVAG